MISIRSDFTGYDIIGDTHAEATKLRRNLTHLGYAEINGVYVPPPDRKAIFIGDYIDRGPSNLEVVDIVRSMINAGYAEGLMGNHEYDAVRWERPLPGKAGQFVRSHTDLNRHHHETFLTEFADDPVRYDQTLDWFKQRPLFVKHGDLHLVHACWHGPTIDFLTNKGVLDSAGRLTEHGWAMCDDKDHAIQKAVEILLKGPEEKLPTGSYQDRGGTWRHTARVAWWNPNPTRIGNAFTSMPEGLPFLGESFIPSLQSKWARIHSALSAMDESARIFIGHIAERGKPAPLLTGVAGLPTVICTDYDVMHQELVAYRTGEPQKGSGGFTRAAFRVPAIS